MRQVRTDTSLERTKDRLDGVTLALHGCAGHVVAAVAGTTHTSRCAGTVRPPKHTPGSPIAVGLVVARDTPPRPPRHAGRAPPRRRHNGANQLALRHGTTTGGPRAGRGHTPRGPSRAVSRSAPPAGRTQARRSTSGVATMVGHRNSHSIPHTDLRRPNPTSPRHPPHLRYTRPAKASRGPANAPPRTPPPPDSNLLPQLESQTRQRGRPATRHLPARCSSQRPGSPPTLPQPGRTPGSSRPNLRVDARRTSHFPPPTLPHHNHRCPPGARSSTAPLGSQLGTMGGPD